MVHSNLVSLNSERQGGSTGMILDNFHRFANEKYISVALLHKLDQNGSFRKIVFIFFMNNGTLLRNLI